MSKKELDEAIFKFDREIKHESKSLSDEDEALCFDIKGEWIKDEQKCAAKRVQTARGIRYFAKWCLDGPDKGHLLNPYSIYFREGDDVKMEQRRGRLRYEFKLISENAFNSYINFLKTKTYIFCQAAEREILNG